MAFGTVAGIAEHAGVQPSTLVRFAKSLGYDGFSHLQQIFRDRLRERFPDYRERLKGLRDAEGHHVHAASLLEGFTNAAAVSLERMRDSVSPEELSRAIETLAKADTIYLLGARRVFPVIAYCAYAFGKLGVRAILIDHVGQLGPEQLAIATKRDAVLAISFTPYAPVTAELAAAAAQRDVPVVAITDSAFSPLVTSADVWLEVAEADFGAFRSLSASFALAMALAVGTAEKRAEGKSGVIPDGAADPGSLAEQSACFPSPCGEGSRHGGVSDSLDRSLRRQRHAPTPPPQGGGGFPASLSSCDPGSAYAVRDDACCLHPHRLSALRRFRRRIREALGHQAVTAGRIARLAVANRVEERGELVAIGLRIALQEEVLHRVGGDARGVGHLHRRAVDVAGADHALRAVHLDALVVAIGGAAGIGDLARSCPGGLQHHGRRVDVAGLADRRIDQRGADRVHLDRLVAEQQEAGHVEIVDHHVAEQAARACDVAHRRRAGIARQDGDEFDLADLAVGEPLLQGCEVRDRSGG